MIWILVGALAPLALVAVGYVVFSDGRTLAGERFLVWVVDVFEEEGAPPTRRFHAVFSDPDEAARRVQDFIGVRAAVRTTDRLTFTPVALDRYEIREVEPPARGTSAQAP